MKIIECRQGDDAWIKARLGLPTASEFHKILTPGGKLSAQARPYAIRLITEELLQRSLETLTGLEWMERGKDLEPLAAKAYEFRQDIETIPVGFITTDDGLIGCSPDRLVGDSGLLEIKVPAPHTHVGYMLDGPGKDYRPQVQGQLYVSERDWVDWLSYSPEMPMVVVRTERDEPYIRALAAELDAFLDMKAELTERVRAAGYFAERTRILTAVDDLRAASNLEEEDVFGLRPLGERAGAA